MKTRVRPLATSWCVLHVIAAIFWVTMCVGCTAGAKLRGQASEIELLTDSMEQRAYRCAPKELAKAKVYTEFGRYELTQGDYVRAKEHLTLAEKMARTADLHSDFDECRDKNIAMVVDPVVKKKVIKAKPAPKDQDGDGLLDDDDKCPLKPEDFDAYQDKDGCPEPDNDLDGIADLDDRCPDVAEDKDDFEDKDGCPEFDNDLDGIADLNDNCKLKAEDYDGFQDDDGCPEADNDLDGIADLLDECINKAEDYDNDQDSDGCPEERKLVKFEGDQIKLGQKIFFKTRKHKIMPVSFPLLDEVAQALKDNANIEIRIEGHTDNRGRTRYNLKLSQRRAAAVLKYLANAGVSRERMRSEGYGKERPIEDNTTKEGRAANRRVEIHITKK